MELKWRPKEGTMRCLSLYLDDVFWRDIDVGVFGCNPRLPKEGSRNELEEAFYTLEYEKAKIYVSRRLTRKSEPSFALAAHLKRKLISERTIKRLIDDFKRLGYLDDFKYIEERAAYLRRRRIGPKLIAQKLLALGFSEEVIERAAHLKNCQEGLVELIERRFRFRNRQDPKEVEKAIAYLCRKGYDLEQILVYFRN